MIWVFWGLLVGLLGGLWLMWFMARKRGSGRYGTPRPPLSRILWALGQSFRYGLWGMGPKLPLFREEPPDYPGEEYTREYQRELDQRDKDGPK